MSLKKSHRGSAFVSEEHKNFCKNRKNGIKLSPSSLHTGTGAVERATQTIKNLILTNLEDKVGFAGNINQALTEMRLTAHTGFKMSLFELPQGSKLRTELTNIIKDNKSYLSEWTTLVFSVTPKHIPIYVARNERREVTDNVIMARNRRTPRCASHKPVKKPGRAN